MEGWWFDLNIFLTLFSSQVVAEKKGLKPKSKKKSDKWKAESNTFRQAMRDNRLMEKAKKEGKPLTYYLD